MMVYSFYETDARVARYAETLVRRGDHVDVISLRQEGQDAFGSINGVNVFRIEKDAQRKGKTDLSGKNLKVFYKILSPSGQKAS